MATCGVSFGQGITIRQLKAILNRFRDEDLEIYVTTKRRGGVRLELHSDDGGFFRTDGDFGFSSRPDTLDVVSEDWQRPYFGFDNNG